MSAFRTIQFLTRTLSSIYLPRRPVFPLRLWNNATLKPAMVEALVSQQQAPGSTSSSILQDFLWFAVPKKKISRHKKRLKTTLQKRIKLKSNIIVDPRTGEVTLQHKMPANWREYLPEM
ncbi:hypothetical protein MPSEU_000664600 [Mayamaea pseudoterrestris]|nr:hypothetical protein MPSEU_000664600 [Mayamaea pseudoterrestris]